MDKELLALWTDPKILQSAVVLVAVIVYIVTLLVVYFRYRRRRLAPKMRLWEALGNGLRSGAVASVEDVVNIYKGIHGLGGDDLSYRAGLAKGLREYLVSVVSEKDRKSDSAKAVKEKITAILNTIEQEDPFSDLPTAERNLLLDVQQMVDLGDGAAAKRKLRGIAGLIEARQDALDRLQSSNRWSIPLAVVGMVLTLIFGFISLQ
jgi:hypothetical protein